MPSAGRFRANIRRVIPLFTPGAPLPSIANAGLSKATRVEPNLSAGGDVPVRHEGGRLVIELPPDAMYLILE